MPFRKVYDSAAAAIADIGDGATVLIGGAAPHSAPSGLLDALRAAGVQGLTGVCDFADGDGSGAGAAKIAEIAAAGVISRLITPALVAPASLTDAACGTFRPLLESGALAIDIVPRGVLAERLRAGGAGIGGVFVPAAAGGVNADAGLETRTINGVDCVLQTPLRADFALLRAARANTMGNLTYQGAQRGWNAVMAAAARITIVEADYIGEPGTIDPERVITPGIYVNRIVAGRAANAAGPDG